MLVAIYYEHLCQLGALVEQYFFQSDDARYILYGKTSAYSGAGFNE